LLLIFFERSCYFSLKQRSETIRKSVTAIDMFYNI
jgi:hypothetical protein